MQAMAPAEQKLLITEKAEQRKLIRQEIEALSQNDPPTSSKELKRSAAVKIPDSQNPECS